MTRAIALIKFVKGEVRYEELPAKFCDCSDNKGEKHQNSNLKQRLCFLSFSYSFVEVLMIY